jgi:hypothetical protein
MGATQTQLSRRQLLWQSYRDAFHHFECEAVRLSNINAQHSSNPAETESALACVEQARLSYNERRDALAASMMSPKLAEFFFLIPTAAHREATRVRTLAEMLWELNGRPQGSAEDDWFRAERVVRYAEAEACCAR